MPGFAIVGASERNIPWTEWLVTSLETHDFAGAIHLVNPRHATLLGRPTVPSVDALPETPDIAALLVGPDQVLVEARKLIGMGTRTLIVVSNGFGETATAEGRDREAELRAMCLADDVLLVGPNCVGFASYHDNVVAISQPLPHGIPAGAVSVISQSGGLTSAAMVAVQREGLGIDMAFSLGNGAAFAVADAISYCAARGTTRVILGVVEALGDRAEIERAAAEARAAGVTVVLLLLGASEGGKAVAASHTGAVVGERRLLASWLTGLGIVLADTPEELGRIATMAIELGREPRAAFIATVSGGGAGLTADLATRHGVRLAQLTGETADSLRGELPAGAYIANPLDIATGNGPAVYAALAADPNVGYLVEPWVLPWPDETHEYHWQRAAMERLAGMAQTAGIPIVIASMSDQPLNEWMRELGTRPGISVTPDLELTLAALGKLHGEPILEGDLRARPQGGKTGHTAAGAMIAEAEARTILENAGLPVVAGGEYGTADELVAAAGETAGPWVVKLSLATVGHKERVGGVILGVSGEDALRAACATIRENAIAAGVTDGSDVKYLLNEMVSGPEILVGLVRDPVAGPCVTIAVGGWAAESGAIFGTLALPARGVADSLRTWGLFHLLGEQRAEGLAAFVDTLGREAVSGSLAGYTTIEINPVMLGRRGPVIVDALILP
ncbi:acetate--CoA ligase family protein [soil metagenome]